MLKDDSVDRVSVDEACRRVVADLLQREGPDTIRGIADTRFCAGGIWRVRGQAGYGASQARPHLAISAKRAPTRGASVGDLEQQRPFLQAHLGRPPDRLIGITKYSERC